MSQQDPIAGPSEEILNQDLPSYSAVAAPLNPSAAANNRNLPLHPAFLHRWDGLGLPSGYFLLRNVQNGRVLDLLGHKTAHGSEIGLHPPKQPTVDAQGSVQVAQNNQVLFLDWDGHLNVASACRPIDCVDDGLVLSWSRPVMSFESSRSHALPRFLLDPHTSTLQIAFESDPSYPGPDGLLDSEDSWRETEYLVEAVPKRRRGEAGIWTTASTGLATASKDILTGLGTLGESAPGMISNLGGRLSGLYPFGRSAPPSGSPQTDADAPPLPPKPLSPEMSTPSSTSASPYPIASTSSDTAHTTKPNSPLPAVPDSDAEDGQYDSDEGSDSDPGAYRPVRIVRLPRSSWKDKFPSEALSSHAQSQLGRGQVSHQELRKWRRRQWEVIPVVVRPKPVHAAPDSSIQGLGLGFRYSQEQQEGPQARNMLDVQRATTRRWSTTASSLASSAGGIVSQAGGMVVSSVSDALRTPILSSVAAAGRRASGATAGTVATEGDDSNEALPDTPGSRGSWDDAMSLPESDIERYLALTRSVSESSRYARSRSASESSARAMRRASLRRRRSSSPDSSQVHQFVIDSGEAGLEASIRPEVMLPDLPRTPSRESAAENSEAEAEKERERQTIGNRDELRDSQILEE